eukprot:11170547-Lingulodinium_polyedra.AAC.1
MAFLWIHLQTARMPCTAHTPAAHGEDATLQVPTIVGAHDVDEEAACGAAGRPGRPRCGGGGV